MKGLDFRCALTMLKIDLQFLRSNLEAMNEVKSQDCKGLLLTQYEPILRDIIYDAEDIIEESECKLDKQYKILLLVKYISLALSRKSWERKKRLKEIKRAIRRYKEKIILSSELDCSLSNRLVLSENDRGQFIPYPTLVHGDEVVGLDSDLEKIKEWIMKPNEQLKVVGIWGMGGVGKTTLVRTICEDRSVKEWFDRILFITVSLKFDLRRVLINMFAEKERSGRDEFELLEELHEQLNEKRYLLILDDVWKSYERSWWMSLKSALPLNNNGSYVVVTTRLKEVARSMGVAEKHIHYCNTLSSNDSCSLFIKKAFPREAFQSPNPFKEAIAKKVAVKCGGLPLVIKALAGDIFKKEPSAYRWRAIAENLDEELNKSGLLDFALRMSFEELPGYLKDCTLSLSIFPEAYEISTEEAVHLWISQGLIHKTEAKTVLEKGEECFDALIDKCLLLGERKDVFETRYQTCRVHNMVRHMIIKIAKEKNFMSLEEERMTLSCSPRVVFIRGSKADHFNELGSKLRILVGREISESRELISNIKSKLLKQKWLRALDLSFAIDGVPNEVMDVDWLDGIGLLPLLTCLKITNSKLKVVPKTIMNLKNLQTLCLYQCYSLKKLPPEMGCLEKLRVLDVSSCASLQYLPMQIERLSNLDMLFGFRPARPKVKGGCGMASLRKLAKLRKLWIQIGFEDQIDKNDLLVLCDLKKLEVLAITVAENGDLTLINKLDCELPSPLEQLHHLYLHRFPGIENPQWLNPTSLPNLSFLHIHKSDIRKFSKGFYGNGEKAWQLEAIVLTSLNELEEDWTKLKTALTYLRLLKVDDCPKLKSLPRKVDNGQGCWMNP
ncbi:hypothetical protein Sjap_025070 [Stephania japonica]|uniref:AAA+ ATPase domain-containing protein n=1 Tax=Stephania japonica TaxID=461633 RepID=A0AAP0HF81_9MAGN